MEFPPKRTIKLIISLVVFLADYLVKGLRLAFGSSPPARCVVLYYHSIPLAHREMFARQMDLLLRHARPLRIDTNSGLAEGGLHVAVTFDDAYENVVHNAIPALSSRNIPATVFVVTENLGGPPAWQNFAAQFSAEEKIMTLEQLRALPPQLVSIGSHTMTHPVLTSIGTDEATREITTSRLRLEKMLGREVRLFSFPYGACSEALVRICRDAGYERVFTINPGLSHFDRAEFVTGRVAVEPTDWLFEFRLKLHGAYRWLPFVFGIKETLRQTPLGRAFLNQRLPARQTS